MTVLRTVRVALALGLVYCLTLGSVEPLDLATGTVLGAAIVLFLGRRLTVGPRGELPRFARRAVAVPGFAGAVLVDIVSGTWDVALRVLHLRAIERPGFVRIPLGDRTDRGVGVSALVSTLSPGTVLVDVDWERREMLLHVIDGTDPDAIRERQQRFYERYQRSLIP